MHLGRSSGGSTGGSFTGSRASEGQGAKPVRRSRREKVAVITRRPTGYYIAHVEGDAFPMVNGVNLGSAAHSLKDKDVIELAGVQMEFLQPGAA